jgi:hypothetical protein
MMDLLFMPVQSNHQHNSMTRAYQNSIIQLQDTDSELVD